MRTILAILIASALPVAAQTLTKEKMSGFQNPLEKSDSKALTSPKIQPSAQQDGTKFSVAGKVIQRTDEGLLVECKKGGITSNKKATGTVFVTGNIPKVFAGGTVQVTAFEAGTYSYVTITGAQSVVQRFVIP